jgi:hypothetical protein
MAHPRTEIRDAAVATLVNKTAAGTRVYPSQLQPWRRSQLPAIAVYCGEERVEVSNEASREYERTVQLVIEGAVSLVGDAEASANALALEIEAALTSDRYLGNLAAKTHKASDTTLVRSQVVLSDDAEYPVAVAELTYEAVYRTLEVTDYATLSDFEQAGMVYHLHGSDAWAATVGGTATDGTYRLRFEAAAFVVDVDVARAAGVPATNADIAAALRTKLDEALTTTLAGVLDAVGGSGAVATYSLESGVDGVAVTASAPAPGTLTIAATHVHASDDAAEEIVLEGATP